MRLIHRQMQVCNVNLNEPPIPGVSDKHQAHDPKYLQQSFAQRPHPPRQHVPIRQSTWPLETGTRELFTSLSSPSLNDIKPAFMWLLNPSFPFEPEPKKAVKDPKGKLRPTSSTEPEARFAFEHSICKWVYVSIASPWVIHLVCTTYRPRSSYAVTAPTLESVMPIPTFCQMAQYNGYGSYRHDTGG